MINVKHKYLFHFIIFFTVIIAQLYFPVIYIKEVNIQADIILLYITVISILYGRFPGIVIGFAGGLLQDFMTQVELLGVFSLSKPISAYIIGSIFNYKNIWSIKIQYLVIIVSYFVHFFIYFYLFSRPIFNPFYIAIFIIIHSTILFILFLVLNSLVYKNKLL